MMENKAPAASDELKEKYKNTVAWIFAANDITWFITIVFSLCLSVWGLICLYNYLDKIGFSHYVWIGLMTMFCSSIIGHLLVCYKDQKYGELFGMTQEKRNADVIKAYSESLDNPKLQALKDFSCSARKFHFRLVQARGAGYTEFTNDMKVQAAARFLVYAAEIFQNIDEIPEYIELSEGSDLYKDAVSLLRRSPASS